MRITWDHVEAARRRAEAARDALDRSPRWKLGEVYPRDRAKASAAYDAALEILRRLLIKAQSPKGGLYHPSVDWD